MNAATTFGSVRDIAQLALDAIYKCEALGMREEEVWQLEDRWSRLVCTPGGSHFSSRSSKSSHVAGDDRICIVEVPKQQVHDLRCRLPLNVHAGMITEWAAYDIADVRLYGIGLPPWCDKRPGRPYVRATLTQSRLGLCVRPFTGISQLIFCTG